MQFQYLELIALFQRHSRLEKLLGDVDAEADHEAEGSLSAGYNTDLTGMHVQNMPDRPIVSDVN